MKAISIVPVILAGGVGSRLWPLSRTKKPKQFCSIAGKSDFTLFEETLERIGKLEEKIHVDKCYVVTGEKYGNFVLSSRNIKKFEGRMKVFLEPSSRNTAASMTLASLYAEEDDILVMLPSDHDFDEKNFHHALIEAVRVCERHDAICLIGIVAERPETGYGYIQAKEADDVFKVRRVLSFNEKPDFDKARAFVENGNYFWNSGIVVVKTKVWRNYLKTLCPDILFASQEVADHFIESGKVLIRMNEELFLKIPKQSVDYAVLEKAVEYDLPMFVVPCYGQWSDLGTWKMVYSHSGKDCNGNVLVGDIKIEECKDSYFFSKDRLMVGLGLNNITAISTPDAVLIFPTSESENVRLVVEDLSDADRSEVSEFTHDVKPWGEATTFFATQEECKIKRLVIKPGQAISLQRHKYREEHWIVVSGTGRVVRDKDILSVKRGDYIYISQGCVHRVIADQDAPVVLVEVQMGSELSEDDIERFEDIYNRS